MTSQPLADALDPPAEEQVPFADLCKLFDRLSSARDRASRLSLLQKFLASYRSILAPGETLHPILRLLLPQLDRSRGAYGAKERKLADMYVRLLCLSKQSSDAQRLYKYRSGGGTTQGAGDFGETVEYVLRNRSTADKSHPVNMRYVNEKLTEMASAHQDGRPRDVDKALMDLAVRLSAVEQKWLVRIILKEMQLGLGHTAILNHFHPDAKDLYDVTSSLERVATDLADPTRRLHEIDVALFTAFRPMLAERSGLEDVEKQMKNRPFYVEPKHDGERVQLHKQNTTYKFFSRNGFDFTSSFGGSPAGGSLVPYIHGQFNTSVESCILDGEMLVWNDHEKYVIVKGEAPDVKALKPGSSIRPMFVPFDVLHLNRQVLTNLPLSERLAKLESIFRPLEGRLGQTTRKSVSTQKEVIDALNEAIDRREEGLILKDPTSVYRPNARRHGWVKVKPEYVDSLVDDLDMVILGGYYGTGHRRGTISQFLLGAAVPPAEPGQYPDTFVSSGRVASGYTEQELRQLLQKLMPHMKRRRADGRPPPGLEWSRDKPDLWIDPRHSQIVQIKATELVESSSHSSGLVPRFPRVVAVRSDKSWHECVTTDQLGQLRQQAAGKLATRHLTELPSRRAAAGTRPPRPGPQLAAHLRPADLSSVQATSSWLAGRVLCVMTGGEGRSKQQLEQMVHSCGGQLTQNPGPETWCVLADTLTVRVRNLIDRGGYTVVRVQWLLRCRDAGRLLPWSPAELIHATEEARQACLLHYDPYGDSYTEPVTPNQLRQLVSTMDHPCRPSTAEVDQLRHQLAPPYGLFTTCRVFLPRTGDLPSPVTSLLLRLHGARILSSLTNRVSHVVMPDGLSEVPEDILVENRSRNRKFHIVGEQWVRRSVQQGRMAEERAYPPSSRSEMVVNNFADH